MHAEDSSSASVNFLIIRAVKQTSDGVYKLTPEKGSAFFLRTRYLKTISEDRLVAVVDGLGENDSLFVPEDCLKPGARGVFTHQEADELVSAALVFACETMAMQYLARAEQCRRSLSQKLYKKGCSMAAVEEALDYLEEKDYLSDRRFAGAWLRTRYIDHAEGRRRLSAELANRGIKTDVAKSALDEYFGEHSELDLCRRAFTKFAKLNPRADGQKIYAALTRYGFSPSMIKKTISGAGDD